MAEVRRQVFRPIGGDSLEMAGWRQLTQDTGDTPQTTNPTGLEAYNNTQGTYLPASGGLRMLYKFARPVDLYRKVVVLGRYDSSTNLYYTFSSWPTSSGLFSAYIMMLPIKQEFELDEVTWNNISTTLGIADDFLGEAPVNTWVYVSARVQAATALYCTCGSSEDDTVFCAGPRTSAEDWTNTYGVIVGVRPSYTVGNGTVSSCYASLRVWTATSMLGSTAWRPRVLL